MERVTFKVALPPGVRIHYKAACALRKKSMAADLKAYIMSVVESTPIDPAVLALFADRDDEN
ncbi:hypothetical protein [Leptolyngbya sp. FACHB-261]|uniref:hypothetical protein n=1 Tax=Leptolyngbya sp. FACHB-261 TaxID=2692806 RepID=UPI001688BA63|nr:hypothetical protein [Leptolyngbya sp. FACHB-261]MBD2099805.1 hypothetical protein [Leptolyngbya sp. FACHB-261]